MMVFVVGLFSVKQLLLALGGLFGGLGYLTTGSILEVDSLDDTDGNGLSHITNGETTQWGEFLEGFNAQRLGGDQVDDGGITRLDEFGVFFGGLTGTTINLLFDFGEFASNVSGVTIQDGSVTVADLTRVVQHNNLGGEISSTLGGASLGITSDITTTQFLDGDVLDVETNVVTGNGFGQSFVMHFNGLDFSGDVGRGEDNNGTGFQDTSFDTTDGYCADTTDFVNILQGQTQRLVCGTGGWQDSIQSFDEGLAFSVTFLTFDLPALEPVHVGGWFQHVITVPAGNWNEGNSSGIVTDLLDVGGDFLLDFFITSLAVWWFRGIHLVDTNDQLFDTQSEGQQGVFTSLTVLGDTSFEFTSTGSNNQYSAISLRGTSDHVLDEISVTRGINDGNIVFGGFEFPQSNIDGDTTLTFGLQFIQNPGVLEGTLTHFLGFLFEFFNGTLVDTTAFVDQMAGSGRFTRIDVANDDNVNMSLFLTHGCWIGL
uniref:Uncharacterized protein n=2 Tax=Haematobia irritans TaxID=7368 RepID=A0A1L8EJ06_HAEIR